MDLNTEKFKQFAITLTRILKELETENGALRITLLSIRESLDDNDLNTLINHAKEGLAAKMNAKYDGPLAEFLAKVDKRESLGEEFLESLGKWKPTDPKN